GRKTRAGGVKHGDVSYARTGSDWVYGAPVKLGNEVKGQLVMGVSTADLEASLTASLAEAEDRAHRSRDRVFLVSLVVLVIGIILAALQGVQLARSEEHTSELQSLTNLVCRLLLEIK